ncbi:Transcription factor S-II/ DNA-directed RNA polymerase I 13.1 kDa polypeptide [Giardia duodenalis assemblage B]|uniref:DNA-directed RNA polymerase subunit n=3 Tax=Giardia intestinalis TaxID=5741 RepID=A0A132NV56_GIAIN|nr:DNA-directed RNA polymerase I 13.1 kDa polypeptide [Giardia intestinalis ATCC 50581]ESU43113.1 Transcription factor S-II [Giardia intestinalis]KWX13960.1 Transcription factor S-II/ DNA-directed RNA polymerase I 13.1 kDa polypeptide [Giardia intestinalis assemblage B]
MPSFCHECTTLLETIGAYDYCALCQKKYERTHQGDVVTSEVHLQTHYIVHEGVTESRPIIDEECPKCHHGQAYYTSMQMRSADEGQTIFFECCNCGHKYRTNT